MKNPPIPDPSTIRTEEDALDQSIALNRITLAILQNQKHQVKMLVIALIASVLVNFLSICAFLWYESQWEYTQTTITQEVSGDGSDINNVEGNQYNDNAIHNDDRGRAE